jgi:hypothetical protein
MKHLIVIGALSVMFASCGDSRTAQMEKQAAIDSMNNVAALQAKQRTIDSMNEVNNRHHHYSNSTAPQGNGEATAEKKGMSNKTKGALIGTGAGVVAGAVAGALINKDDPGKGAAIGGALGGAVGSGVGYGAGAAKDKKKKTTTTTNP